MSNLTEQRLRELLDYDQETGLFRRKIATSNIVKVGDTAGSVSNGYIDIGVDRSRYYAHRLAWLWVYGVWPTGQIDHIDGNRLNNRISNLRDVSRAANVQNQRRANSDSKTGLLGVSRKHKRWKAQIGAAGANRHLGTFDTPEEAHQAYLVAKREMHEGCTL